MLRHRVGIRSLRANRFVMLHGCGEPEQGELRRHTPRCPNRETWREIREEQDRFVIENGPESARERRHVAKETILGNRRAGRPSVCIAAGWN